MSLISSVRTFVKTYAGLADGAPVFVDQHGAQPVEYAVVPLPGGGVIEAYIDGSSLREYPFALQSVEYTIDDAARLAAAEFYEGFAAWLEAQTEAGTLPTLGAGQAAVAIEATAGGHLYTHGTSGTGIYQILCRLVYEQEA